MAESIGEGRGCCLVQAEGKFNATFLIFASTRYHTALVDNEVLRDPPSPPAQSPLRASRTNQRALHAPLPAQHALPAQHDVLAHAVGSAEQQSTTGLHPIPHSVRR